MEFLLGMLAGVAVLFVGSVIEDRIAMRRMCTKIHSAFEEREGRKLSDQEVAEIWSRYPGRSLYSPLDDPPSDPPI